MWSSSTTPKVEEQVQKSSFTPTQASTPTKFESRVTGEERGMKETNKLAAVPPLNVYQQQQQPAATPTPRWKSALKLVVASLVLAAFALAVLVAVMEVKDPSFRNYIDQTPAVDAFRHRYYDPSRDYVMNMFGRR